MKKETRQRVLEIIQKVNFQPNLAARSMRVGRTNVIGLVIPAGISAIFTDPFFPQLVKGISTKCNLTGYSVMLWLAEPEFERQMINRILHSGLLDGVIVSSMVIDDPIVLSLSESKMPFVLIGRHPTLEINHIDIDNSAGGYTATMHLLQLGYKKIATITGPQNLIAGYDRYQGYQKALKESGIRFDEKYVEEGDFTETGGYKSLNKLLPEKPDGVFIANDTMALGAQRAIREAGLQIPEDIAIVSFDDIPGASTAEPPLTTIKQPIQKMGASAVEKLIAIIDHPESESNNVILPTKLIVRESCGANATIKTSRGGDA